MSDCPLPQSGGAVLMPWLDQVSAVLAAWYPGQRGGEAIARLLWGEVNPSGRLPLTFPARDADAPRPQPAGLAEMRARDAKRAAGDKAARIERFEAHYDEGANVGYRWFEASDTRPLFPFGYGLSYTAFTYDDIAVIDGAEPRVTLTITNAGDRAGADVPQVYVRAADGAGVMTWRLAAFARVELANGERAEAELTLEPRAFARWNVDAGCWELPEAAYELALGRSATDLVWRTSLDARLIRLPQWPAVRQ